LKILRKKMPPDVEFEPPSDLSDSSQRLWRAIVPRRALSPGRLALLTTALEARDRAEAARVAIEKDGLTSTTLTTGAIHAHPLLRVEKDFLALFTRCWVELGLGWDAQIDGTVIQRVREGFPPFEDEEGS
jgi:hypothetical protein